MNFPIERQQQSDGMLGDRVRRVRWHTYHGQPQFPGRSQVHVVVTGTAQGEQPDALGRQCFQTGAVCVIVDEDAHGLRAFGRSSCVHTQPEFVEPPRNAI